MKPFTMTEMLTAVDYALSFHLGHEEEDLSLSEMRPFSDVVSIAQVVDSPDPKLLLTMRDGSQFALLLTQEHWPEIADEEHGPDEDGHGDADHEDFGADLGLSPSDSEPYFPE